MSRPRLLDLFCGAGGAAVGYHRAGFDVVGVDIEPQPHYPFDFIQADVFGWLARHPHLSGFDCVHASPVCKGHSKLANATGRDYSDTAWQLGQIRWELTTLRCPKPWVIENVLGAPMRPDYKLCGCMFGLPGLRRERWFEVPWGALDPPLDQPQHTGHTGRAITVAGHGAQGWEYKLPGGAPTQADREAAMGIDWMNRDELAEAIPPAFTEFVGQRLMSRVRFRGRRMIPERGQR